MEDTTIVEDVFTLPAKPWGEQEVAYIMAHQIDLDDETKMEMGIIPYPEKKEVKTPTENK